MQKNLQTVLLVLLCLIPFLAWGVADGRFLDVIPLDSAGLFFPFITGKNFGFRVLVELAFIVWIYLAVRMPEYRLRSSKLLVAYSAFMVALFIASMFGVDPLKSFFSNYERMEGFVTHLHLFMYFVILISTVRTHEMWEKLMKAFFASNILVLIWSYLQLLGSSKFFLAAIAPNLANWFATYFPIHMSGYRLDSTLGNSAYLAIYVLIFAGIALIYMFRATTRNARLAYGALALLNAIALYYTATRGALLGLVVGVIVASIFLVIKGGESEKKYAYGFLVTVALCVALIFGFRHSQFVLDSPTLARFASINPQELTTFSRLNIWKMSYEGWKDRPIFGYGQDNFGAVFAKYYTPNMWDQEPWFDRSHNVFFDWLVAAGVVGLVTYLSLFAVVIYLIVFKRGDLSRKEQAILLGLLAAYFVHNFFVFDNLISYILFFTLLAYVAARTDAYHHERYDNIFQTYGYVVEPVVALLTALLFWYSVYLPYRANTLMIQAIDTGRLQAKFSGAQLVQAQLDLFKKALGEGSFGNREIREQFIQAGLRTARIDLSQVTGSEGQAIAQAQTDFANAVHQAIETAPKVDKEDARELEQFGIFYNGVGQFKIGETYLVQSHTISPHKQRINFDLIYTYIQLGKNKEAYDLALSTYKDDITYPEALNAYAITSVYTKRDKEAKQVLKADGKEFPVSNQIISAYIEVKNTVEARRLLLELKAKYPEQGARIDAMLKELNGK
jgi:O-antigen ligase